MPIKADREDSRGRNRRSRVRRSRVRSRVEIRTSSRLLMRSPWGHSSEMKEGCIVGYRNAEGPHKAACQCIIVL